MKDLSKFEQMLERLINEDRSGAEALFHEIVVNKSRRIYESLLEADFDKEMDDDGYSNKGLGGDPTDDMIDQTEVDDESEDDMDSDVDSIDDMGTDDDLQDRVVDLEDALDDLRSEFEKMMSEVGADEGDEGGEEDEGDEGEMDFGPDTEEGDEEDEGDEDEMDFGPDTEEGDEEDEGDEDEMDFETPSPKKESRRPMSQVDQMREYVEKVTAKMGDNGAYTKSPVAGKNNMGGTAANIVSGGESKKGGTSGGLQTPKYKEENAGNVNVPNGKASKSMKAFTKGHGAEKKGQGEKAANRRSVIGAKRIK